MALSTARAGERRAPRLRSLPLRGAVVDPAGGVRRWPLRRLFVVGAGVTAVFTLVAILVGAAALYRLTEARRALVDIDMAVAAGQQLALGVLDQAVGLRGFRITGAESFLAPYLRGTAAEAEAAGALRGLTASGRLGLVGPDVEDVVAAVQRWRGEYAEPTVAAVRAGVAAPDPFPGQALFDTLRARLDVLTADLAGQQSVARQRVGDAAAFLLVVAVVLAALLVGFLVAVGVGLQRGVLTPVSRLAVQVRQMVSGDLAQPVRATGPREISELGADVEAMRAHIVRELEVLQQVNRRLDEQARDLERSNRDLEQFAYVASHDLQEPLRKVSSFCQLLARRYGGQLDERADQYIAFATDGAQRMQRLINDLLTFSRVGRTTEGFGQVELSEVARTAAAQLDTTRAEAGGEIVVGDLPAVRGDPALLRQLLLNLVGNGLKFARDGVPPVIGLSAQRSDGGWEVAVTDNGIGIEPAYVDKVFVIFQRLHARDRYAGTGIGLALAKKIVEFHGGRIWVDTEPRAEPGTTVRFTLPAGAPDPTATLETP